MGHIGNEPGNSSKQTHHHRLLREVPYEPVRSPDWWYVAHNRFSVAGAALTVTVVLWVGLSFLISLALHVINPDVQVPAWLYIIISNGPLYIIAMPVGWFMLSTLPVLPTRQFSLGGTRFWSLMIMCVPLIYAGNLIGSLLATLLSGGESVDRVSELVDNIDPIITFVLVVIVAPFFEEWTFRKQLIDHIRQYGEQTAILLSGFSFALFHQNIYQFFYTFALGLVFGYVYVRTSRIRYTIAMHMIVNFNGGVIAPWVLSKVDDKALDSLESIDSNSPEQAEQVLEQFSPGVLLVIVYGMIMIGLLIAGVILLVQRRKSLEFYMTPEELPRGLRARTALLNPGFIFYIIICVALTVLALFT